MSSRQISGEVRRHLAAGELEEALVLLKSAFVSYPGSLFFSERLVVVAHEAGDHAACRQALERARRLGSSARTLTLVESKLLLQEGEVASAVEKALGLCNAEPPDEEGLRCAAEVLRQLSHPGALVALGKLAAHGWLDPGELLNASRHASALGEHEAGHAFIERLLARHPHHEEALRERVVLHVAAPSLVSEQVMSALAALSEVSLPAAMEFLADLLRLHCWQAVLFLLTCARKAELTADATRHAGPQLAEAAAGAAAALAQRRPAEAAAILLCLAEAAGPTDGAEIAARAAEAAELAVTAAGEALLRGDRPAARESFLALLPLVEHAGLPVPGLGLLGERLDLPREAARAWLCHWRMTRDEAALLRAAGAAADLPSPCAAFAQFVAVPGMPLNDPGLAAIGLRLARAANEELTAAEGQPDENLIAGAAALIRPDVPESWPRGGVRGYAGRLRQSMKQADEAGDRAGAIRCAEAAIALDAEKAHPYKVLARLLTDAGQVPRARESLRRLCELEPENPEHAIRLARRCRAGDGSGEALDVLLPALGRHPRHADLRQLVDRWLCEPTAPA